MLRAFRPCFDLDTLVSFSRGVLFALLRELNCRLRRSEIGFDRKDWWSAGLDERRGRKQEELESSWGLAVG